MEVCPRCPAATRHQFLYCAAQLGCCSTPDRRDPVLCGNGIGPPRLERGGAFISRAPSSPRIKSRLTHYLGPRYWICEHWRTFGDGGRLFWWLGYF